MFKNVLLTTLAGLIVLAMAQQASADPDLGETGVFTHFTYTSSSITRDCRMVVPTNYDEDKPLGILYGFHGGARAVSAPPKLDYLQALGLEATAETHNWITVSLSCREGGTWAYTDFSTSNIDGIAIEDLYHILAAYYSIDDNRLYATGYSNGGAFTQVLPYAMPGFFAARAPMVPARWDTPPSGTPIPVIGMSGTEDPYGLRIINIQGLNKTEGVECDGYIFHSGHGADMADDPVTDPAMVWYDLVLEFLEAHPKNFQSDYIVTPSRAQTFRDEFSVTGPAPLDGDNWRIRSFDDDGFMTFSVMAMGTPADPNKVSGYTFQIDDGYLENKAIGYGEQAGYCVTKYAPLPLRWETSFIADNSPGDLVIWPAILQDIPGPTVYLELTSSAWAWKSAATNLAFRTDYTSDITTLASGSWTLSTSVEYDVEVTYGVNGLTYDVIHPTSGSVISGSLSYATVGLENCKVGMGVKGTGAQIRFGYAELASPEYWLASEQYSSIQGKNDWHYRFFWPFTPDVGYHDMTYVPAAYRWSVIGQAPWYSMIDSNWQWPLDVNLDAARVWKAPFDGDIDVTSEITKYDAQGDGILAAIIHRYDIGTEDEAGDFLWGPTTITDAQAHTANVSSVTVEAGDEIIFITDCKTFNGASDVAGWDPTIVYSE